MIGFFCTIVRKLKKTQTLKKKRNQQIKIKAQKNQFIIKQKIVKIKYNIAHLALKTCTIQDESRL